MSVIRTCLSVFFCLSVCQLIFLFLGLLFICRSVCQWVCYRFVGRLVYLYLSVLSVCLFLALHLYVFQSANMSVGHSVCVLNYFPGYLLNYMLCISVYFSITHHIHLSISLPVCLSVRVHVSVCLSLRLCLSFCLCLFLCTWKQSGGERLSRL